MKGLRDFSQVVAGTYSIEILNWKRNQPQVFRNLRLSAASSAS